MSLPYRKYLPVFCSGLSRYEQTNTCARAYRNTRIFRDRGVRSISMHSRTFPRVLTGGTTTTGDCQRRWRLRFEAVCLASGQSSCILVRQAVTFLAIGNAHDGSIYAGLPPSRAKRDVWHVCGPRLKKGLSCSVGQTALRKVSLRYCKGALSCVGVCAGEDDQAKGAFFFGGD